MNTIVITCFNTLFMLLNFILLAFGLVLLTIGVTMKYQLSQFFKTLTADNHDQLPWILICFGAGIIIIGNSGCIFTSKGVAPLLYMYAIFLMIVFFGTIGIGIYGFVMKGIVSKSLDDGLIRSMDAYYSDDEYKQYMDQLQRILKCCGNNSSQDWFSIPWQDGKATSKSVPMSCCKEKTCVNTDTSVIYNEGCYSKVTSFLKMFLGAIGGPVIGFAFVQLLGGVMTYQLAKHINKLNVIFGL